MDDNEFVPHWELGFLAVGCLVIGFLLGAASC